MKLSRNERKGLAVVAVSLVVATAITVVALVCNPADKKPAVAVPDRPMFISVRRTLEDL